MEVVSSSSAERRLIVQDWLDGGDGIHGSATLHLPYLEPRVTRNLALHDDTGERHDPVCYLYATDDHDLAIAYSALALLREIPRPFWRAFGITGSAQEPYRYYASDAMKAVVRARQGRVGALYRVPGAILTHDPREDEFHTSETVKDPDWIVADVADLSFDFYRLRAPATRQSIRDHQDLYGYPPETLIAELHPDALRPAQR